jgi:hypothetical protein
MLGFKSGVMTRKMSRHDADFIEVLSIRDRGWVSSMMCSVGIRAPKGKAGA